MVCPPISCPVDTIRRSCALLLLTLVGCQGIAYAPLGPEGGYSELDFSSDVFEARFEGVGGNFHFPAVRKLALLRGAELAQARGAVTFCVESIYEYRGSVRDYVAYTIRAFETAPANREIASADSVHPALHACYEASETERWLKAKHNVE